MREDARNEDKRRELASRHVSPVPAVPFETARRFSCNEDVDMPAGETTVRSLGDF